MGIHCYEWSLPERCHKPRRPTPLLNPRHFGDIGGGKTSEGGTYLSFSVPKMEARYSAITPNLPGPGDRRIPWHPPNTSQVRDGNICRPTTREMIERPRPIGTERWGSWEMFHACAWCYRRGVLRVRPPCLSAPGGSA